MRRYVFWQASVPFGLGRPIGGLTFIVKAFLQGKVFNNELPKSIFEKLLFTLAWSIDLIIWYVLVLGILNFYCNSIGGLL